METALRTVHALNVVAFGDGLFGAVNGMRLDGSVDESSEQSAEVWVGTTYALAAFMIGRGLVDEGWETARGAVAVTYERGLWFRTPEALRPSRATSGRASTFGRSRSGPLRVPCAASGRADRPPARSEPGD